MFLCVIDNSDEECTGTGDTFEEAYYNAGSSMTTEYTPYDATFYECSLISVKHEIKFSRNEG